MSNSDDMNLNVQDYDQEDLLTLLNIQDKDPINYDDIVNASQPYIEKYTSEDNYDLANFFQQVQNQLLEDILSKSVQIIQNEAIKIITEIGKQKNLALTLDTSSVVIAANSINISKNVITLLNINLPTLNMNEIMLDSK